MPIGGKLLLKGGDPLAAHAVGGVKKKKKAKREQALPGQEEEGGPQQGEGAPAAAAPDPTKPKPADPRALSVLSGKAYEEEFHYEGERAQKGKARSTPWGATYRQPMEIPHGYDRKITGKTAEERLDLRSTTKADKFCK